MLPVHVAAVRDFDHEHSEHGVVDFVEKAVVSNSKTEDTGFAGQGLDACRTRVVLQGQEAFVEPLLNVSWQSEKGALRGRLEEKAVAAHLNTMHQPEGLSAPRLGKPGLTADLFVRDFARFRACDQDGFGIETVFNRLDQRQIVNRHQCGHGLSVPLKDDPLPFVRDAVESLGERIPDGGGGNAGHGRFVSIVRFVR